MASRQRGVGGHRELPIRRQIRDHATRLLNRQVEACVDHNPEAFGDVARRGLGTRLSDIGLRRHVEPASTEPRAVRPHLVKPSGTGPGDSLAGCCAHKGFFSWLEAVVSSASVSLICPACQFPWRQVSADPSASTTPIRCLHCGQPATILEAAAAAWALGHITHGDFFELAGRVAPEEIGEALAALAKIAAWWEQRTGDQQPGGNPSVAGDGNGWD